MKSAREKNIEAGIIIFSLSCCSWLIIIWYPMIIIFIPVAMTFGFLGSFIIPDLIYGHSFMNNLLEDW